MGLRRMNKRIIGALLDEDLKKVLVTLDVYDRFLGRDLKCAYCSSILDDSNLLAIFSAPDKNYKFVCNNPICHEKFSEGST